MELINEKRAEINKSLRIIKRNVWPPSNRWGRKDDFAIVAEGLVAFNLVIKTARQRVDIKVSPPGCSHYLRAVLASHAVSRNPSSCLRSSPLILREVFQISFSMSNVTIEWIHFQNIMGSSRSTGFTIVLVCQKSRIERKSNCMENHEAP